MKEYIAYRERDPEGDAWSERVFLFEDRDSVKSFFSPDNPDLIKLYCSEELYDPITYFEINDNNPANHITEVMFKTIFAGQVFIIEMYKGHLIPNTQQNNQP